MSIDALIFGRLHRAPKQHTASSGMLYTTATVRTATRDGNAIFVSVIAFESEPANALLALAEGDSVALAGELTPKVWKPKDGGEPRPALDLCVHAVLTEYHVARRRKAMQEARGHAETLPFNDRLPRGAA